MRDPGNEFEYSALYKVAHIICKCSEATSSLECNPSGSAAVQICSFIYHLYSSPSSIELTKWPASSWLDSSVCGALH